MNRTRQSGFSMIEVMVAAFAAAILGLVVGTILVIMTSNVALLGAGNRSDSAGVVYLQRDAEVAIVALNAALRGAFFSNTVANSTPGSTLNAWSNVLIGTFSVSASNLLYSRPGQPDMILAANRLAAFSWSHDSTNRIFLTLVFRDPGLGATMTNNETVRVRNR